MSMHKIARKRIVIGNRQRSANSYQSLRDADLRRSIESKGLLHPIVVRAEGEGDNIVYHIVAGGRRLAAIDWIAEQGGSFTCDNEPIAPGEVPATLLSDILSPADVKEAELEENWLRVELPWQDRVRALVEIDRLRADEAAAEGRRHTDVALAKELKERKIEALASGAAGGGIRRGIMEARWVEKHLDKPEIRNARNMHEAYNLALRHDEAHLRAIQVSQGLKRESPVRVQEGDALAVLPTLAGGTFDLIIADPPYAIDAGAAGFRSRTVHHHNYDDSRKAAEVLIKTILTEGFRACKSRANLFLFTDIGLWPWIFERAEQAGWSPFRTPIIWAKSDSEGLAPWGGEGFRRTYEIIFFATKNGRGLVRSPVDILRHNRVPRTERDYGAAKPEALMRELMECSTLPNDYVLDPCCGSGATLVAAKATSRRALGIEKDHAAYNLTMAKLGEPNALATAASAP
jgi:DNA modification methylase/ParB-like chromosome segregation protein Spo0J